jgi:hypothetical protein
MRSSVFVAPDGLLHAATFAALGLTVSACGDLVVGEDFRAAKELSGPIITPPASSSSHAIGEGLIRDQSLNSRKCAGMCQSNVFIKKADGKCVYATGVTLV